MTDKYEENWRRYKSTRALCLFLLFGWICWMLANEIYHVQRFIQDKHLMRVVLYGWMIAFGITSFLLVYWLCPRCKKFFFRKGLGGLIYNQFSLAKKCVHCGLPKYASEAEVQNV